MKDAYSLSEIGDWTESGLVSLPTVQRGFVWKASQMENLWDSILRGYPIGAFVLSLKSSGRGFEILDGQQRATAICLGLGARTFRDSNKNYRMFIDLIQPPADDNRLFIFRVITKSHPWGYERRDNSRPLLSSDKRLAMMLYGIQDHLKMENLEDCFPYDADLPIPFEFFLKERYQAANPDEIIQRLSRWNHWPNIKGRWASIDPANRPDSLIESRITIIAECCEKALSKDNPRRIPVLHLDFNELTKAATSSETILHEENDRGDGQEDQDRVDEIENLFVRLNAGGTPLQGEELNYSILKAHITRDLQDKIERACDRFVNPARFVTIAYRLYQQSKRLQGREAITMKVKPKQFQRAVGDDREGAFARYLENTLLANVYEGLNLIAYIRSILLYDPASCRYGLPYPTVVSLGHSAPELCFLLMFRVTIYGDRFEKGSTVHRSMLGVITLCKWLGKNGNQRDYSKVLQNIWPGARSLQPEQFWSNLTIARARINNILANFPTVAPELDKSLAEALLSKPIFNESFWTKIEKKFPDLKDFLWCALDNGDILLYTQREFVDYFFKPEHFHLEDSDTPFDWDHLSPNSLINRKRNIPEAIKSVYQTNGNFRAWPYSLNRMDQDATPMLKLDPLSAREVSDNDSSFWIEFLREHKAVIKNKAEFKKKLLEWSGCDPEWATCDVTDFTKDEWKVAYDMIMRRNLELLKNWYLSLNISSLLQPNAKFSPLSFLDSTSWQSVGLLNLKLSEHFKDDNRDVFVSKKTLRPGHDLRFFITTAKQPDELIHEGNIEFGLLETDSAPVFKDVDIPGRLENRYRWSGNHWMWGVFTLIANTPSGIDQLIREIRDWFVEFPDKNFSDMVAAFDSHLVKKK